MMKALTWLAAWAGKALARLAKAFPRLFGPVLVRVVGDEGGGTVNRPAFVNEIDGEWHDPQWND